MFSSGMATRRPVPGPAVGLADFGPTGLLQLLQLAVGVGQADLGELGADGAAAPLEHPEDVGRRRHLPGGEGRERRQVAPRRLLGRHRTDRLAGAPRREDFRRLAGPGVGLAQDVVLVGQDAVVVAGASEQHGVGGHDRALAGVHHVQVAGPAGVACRAVVRRVLEPDELGALLVQQGVGLLGVGRARIAPGLGVERQDVRPVAGLGVGLGLGVQPLAHVHRGVAAVAVGAAENHVSLRVHGHAVHLGVAAHAAGALRVRLFLGLGLRSRRRPHAAVVGQARELWLLALLRAGVQRPAAEQLQGEHHGDEQPRDAERPVAA